MLLSLLLLVVAEPVAMAKEQGVEEVLVEETDPLIEWAQHVVLVRLIPQQVVKRVKVMRAGS
jgi:hypothetical protein